jgi:hypothetical protein
VRETCGDCVEMMPDVETWHCPWAHERVHRDYPPCSHFASRTHPAPREHVVLAPDYVIPQEDDGEYL